MKLFYWHSFISEESSYWKFKLVFPESLHPNILLFKISKKMWVFKFWFSESAVVDGDAKKTLNVAAGYQDKRICDSDDVFLTLTHPPRFFSAKVRTWHFPELKCFAFENYKTANKLFFPGRTSVNRKFEILHSRAYSRVNWYSLLVRWEVAFSWFIRTF